MYRGTSEFQYNEVQNSPSSSKVFDLEGVYYLKLVNDTLFEIIVTDRLSGSMRIKSGGNVEWFGYPEFPTKVSLNIAFNAIAAATDFLIIITTSCNGSNFKEC